MSKKRLIFVLLLVCKCILVVILQQFFSGVFVGEFVRSGGGKIAIAYSLERIISFHSWNDLVWNRFRLVLDTLLFCRHFGRTPLKNIIFAISTLAVADNVCVTNVSATDISRRNRVNSKSFPITRRNQKWNQNWTPELKIFPKIPIKMDKDLPKNPYIFREPPSQRSACGPPQTDP